MDQFSWGGSGDVQSNRGLYSLVTGGTLREGVERTAVDLAYARAADELPSYATKDEVLATADGLTAEEARLRTRAAELIASNDVDQMMHGFALEKDADTLRGYRNYMVNVHQKKFTLAELTGDSGDPKYHAIAQSYLDTKVLGATALDGTAGAAALAGRKAPNRTPIETSSGAIVRPADSPNYSVATEVRLPSNAYPGASRRRHNQISNQALHESFESDPAFAARMESLYPGIVDGVRPGPRGAFPDSRPTPDVTWHHGTEPGQMQLIPRDHHIAPGPVQDALHPGPNRGGGFVDWGTE